MAHAMRIPALLLLSIVVVNSLFYPGATDVLASLGPLSITREGLSFGLISAGRVLVAFLAAVAFLFTTLADDMLETLIARGASHRISFVILSAVQMVPRMQERAGSILEAQQARGLSIEGSFGRRLRALVPLIGPVRARLARRRPRADVRARGARVRGAAGPDGLSDRRRSADRPLAAPGDRRGSASRWSSRR